MIFDTYIENEQITCFKTTFTSERVNNEFSAILLPLWLTKWWTMVDWNLFSATKFWRNKSLKTINEFPLLITVFHFPWFWSWIFSDFWALAQLYQLQMCNGVKPLTNVYLASDYIECLALCNISFGWINNNFKINILFQRQSAPCILDSALTALVNMHQHGLWYIWLDATWGVLLFYSYYISSNRAQSAWSLHNCGRERSNFSYIYSLIHKLTYVIFFFSLQN